MQQPSSAAACSSPAAVRLQQPSSPAPADRRGTHFGQEKEGDKREARARISIKSTIEAEGRRARTARDLGGSVVRGRDSRGGSRDVLHTVRDTRGAGCSASCAPAVQDCQRNREPDARRAGEPNQESRTQARQAKSSSFEARTNSKHNCAGRCGWAGRGAGPRGVKGGPHVRRWLAAPPHVAAGVRTCARRTASLPPAMKKTKALTRASAVKMRPVRARARWGVNTQARAV